MTKETVLILILIGCIITCIGMLAILLGAPKWIAIFIGLCASTISLAALLLFLDLSENHDQ